MMFVALRLRVVCCVLFVVCCALCVVPGALSVVCCCVACAVCWLLFVCCCVLAVPYGLPVVRRLLVLGFVRRLSLVLGRRCLMLVVRGVLLPLYSFFLLDNRY